MKTERSIDVFNTLIKLNNDRIEGYKSASDETDQTDLKILFAELIWTSEHCKNELEQEVCMMSGIPAEGTSLMGDFFRTWTDLKMALCNNNRKVILNAAEFGEDAAVDTYKEVIENNLEYLSDEQQTTLNAQLALIKTGFFKVKSLRDRLQEVV